MSIPRRRDGWTPASIAIGRRRPIAPEDSAAFIVLVHDDWDFRAARTRSMAAERGPARTPGEPHHAPAARVPGETTSEAPIVGVGRLGLGSCCGGHVAVSPSGGPA